MRALTKVAVGGGLATALTLLGLTVAGVATTTVGVALDPLAPPASAAGLERFGDCAELLAWYQDRAVADVGPYGWADEVMAYAAKGAAPLATVPVPGALDDTARGSSATGTNTQVGDVDEPDVAKTDGRIVVRVTGAGDLVVTDVSGVRPRLIGRLALPTGTAYDAELMLIDGHALVLGSDTGFARPLGAGPTDLSTGPTAKILVPAGSRLVDVDLSDPAAPRVAHVEEFSGRLVSARSYGGTVRVVTSTGRPELAWAYPEDVTRASLRTATLRNRALVRATTLADWLPSVSTDGRPDGPVGCHDVLHPRTRSGTETLAVTTFRGDDVTRRQTVGLTADAQVVYSSADQLYVAAERGTSDPAPPRPEPGSVNGGLGRVALLPTPSVTDLHAFALDGDNTRYVGSGSVAGTLRDRWSLDEQGGILRVAWSRESGTRTTNGISTYAERDGALVQVGELGHLGTDETIQSVRWLGDLAVLVTYRQVDPLFTVDLTDPARPRALGALKLLGYSGYLHPIGDHLLLGLGEDATADGRSRGGQAATFDLSDPTRPTRVSHVGLGVATFPTAVDEPRAFTWLPDQRTALTTVQPFGPSGARLVALRVGSSGALTVQDLAIGVDASRTRVLPLGDGRVAVASDAGVRVLDLG